MMMMSMRALECKAIELDSVSCIREEFVFAGSLSDPTLVATVFAPSNDAFTNYLTANNLTADQLLAAPTLGSILKFHVVPGIAAQVRTNTTIRISNQQYSVSFSKFALQSGHFKTRGATCACKLS